MGFIFGSSSLVSSPSSSFLLCSHRKLTRKKMKSSGLLASFNSSRTREEESSSSHRRSFLFLGISALPFLHLRAIAAEDPGKQDEQEPEVIMSKKKDIGKREEKEPLIAEQEMSSPKLIQSEQVPVQEVRGSPFVSLFNVLGIIAAGVLGALYATSQKEKATMEATIESVNNLKTWNTDR